MKANKKAVKIIAVVLCVIIVLSTALFAVNSVGINRMFTDDEKITGLVDEKLKALGETTLENFGDTFYENFKDSDKAVPVAERFKPYIDECNKAIIKYFKDKYGVDYTERFAELEVLMYTFKFQNIKGFYEEERHNNIYLNIDFLKEVIGIYGTEEQTDDTFQSEFIDVGNFNAYYIHEAVHYVTDIPEDENIPGSLCEGMTDWLVKRISEYTGIEVYITSDYGIFTEYADQMIRNDDQLIPEILNNKNYDFVEYFDERYGEEFYLNYDRLLELTCVENGKYFDSNVQFILQYYTINYLKTVNKDFGKEDFTLKLVPAAGLRYLIKK